MACVKVGGQTVLFENGPHIVGFGCVAGRKEGQGPLGRQFGHVDTDDRFGQDSWEKAESEMQKRALDAALSKAGVQEGQVDFLFAGDLLNQCIGSGYAARGRQVPFFGLYGACSTMGEGLCLAAITLGSGAGQRAAVCASSHFCTAERQYRNPLEYGGQRTPTAQWTVTGAGAVVLGQTGRGPQMTACTVGRVVDKGITDANNMGAAMAPAAYDTLAAHFRETGTTPADYDLILTGDLGALGHEIVTDFFLQDGIDMRHNYQDCGLLLYDLKKQDMHAGGSGCGCSASVLNGYLLRGMRQKKWNRILFAPTGALLSPTSTFQGESIPSICHAVVLSNQKGVSQ